MLPVSTKGWLRACSSAAWSMAPTLPCSTENHGAGTASSSELSESEGEERREGQCDRHGHPADDGGQAADARRGR